MTIGIDGNEANVKEKVGVSNYTLHLLNYFHKVSNVNLKFIVYLRKQPNEDLPKPNELFKYEIVKGLFYWSQVFLPINLFLKRKINIFLTPAHYSPRFSPVPTVVTIHDLSYFYYPNDFLKKDLNKLINWTKYSVNNAKKIIAVSKTTKKDIVKFYDIPEDKIEVVYNGYEKKCQMSNVKCQNQILNLKTKMPYILYVGTLQPRKNISTLIKAFELFNKENPKYKLLIAGKKGWMYKKEQKQNVEYLDYVSDNELINLYKNAFCFVLPSLYEGFGIPILEAMSYNCPVITSFSSSLPEIGGDACLYFDPTSEKELSEKIDMLKNNNLRNELIKKGKERIKLFSWNKCAKETLQILVETGHAPSLQNTNGN